MRKFIKVISLVLCLVLFGVFLGGCSYIDELRKSHAIISDDKSAITFRGQTYKKLPKTDKELYCTYNFFGNYFTHDVTITDADVPVLLKNQFNYSGGYDLSKDIFCIFNIDVDFINANENKYYCNEADYDRYVEALQNGVLDHIGFEYETWDSNADYYYVLEPANSVLNEEILGIIENPETMTEEVFEEANKSMSYDTLYGNLFKCDETGSVVECLSGFDIWKSTSDNKAYIINYDLETAALLSDKAAKALKDEYFTGYFPGIENEGDIVYLYN